MTEKDKQLLLKDICARLLYGVKCRFETTTDKYKTIEFSREGTNGLFVDFDELYCYWLNDGYILPYLRPMSSMTEEERDEIEEMSHGWFYVNENGEIFPMGQFTDSGEFEDAILPTLDWLNENMFDFRGLIPMGLALEAPKDMYKTE